MDLIYLISRPRTPAADVDLPNAFLRPSSNERPSDLVLSTSTSPSSFAADEAVGLSRSAGRLHAPVLVRPPTLVCAGAGVMDGVVSGQRRSRAHTSPS